MTYVRWLTVALSFALCTASAQSRDAAVERSRQLVVVITDDWNANQGSLYTYTRDNREWVQRSAVVPVSIGSKGSAWGIGVHESQPGPIKVEGDGRSPAGIFTIGTAFGYSSNERSRLPYEPMTEFHYCIDVTGSPMYNRIVDERDVGRDAIAGSTEPMRRDLHANGDQRYKLGFVIEHNSKAKPAAGSCIFAHLWNSPGQTTAGCTAMDENTLRKLLEWLDSDEQPLFVLLPRKEYQRLADRWELPKLAEHLQ